MLCSSTKWGILHFLILSSFLKYGFSLFSFDFLLSFESSNQKSLRTQFGFINHFEKGFVRTNLASLNTWVNKMFCVTLIKFIPLIKWIPQFLMKGKLFLGEGGEREREIYFLCGLKRLSNPSAYGLVLANVHVFSQVRWKNKRKGEIIKKGEGEFRQKDKK